MDLRVAIVGCGTMGSRLAIRCAEHGCEVVAIARDRLRADAALRAAADEVEATAALGRIEVATVLDAVASASIVCEAIPESLERKQELFAELEDFVGDHVPLASGTSTFLPDALGRYLEFPGRVFVAHFVHPVTVVPLAEVVAPLAPDPEALGTFDAWLVKVELEPIRLVAPLAGFIVNRLQFALLREALAIVESGTADGATVDAVVRLGLAPRWTATGPIESIALGGAKTFADVARAVVPTLASGQSIAALEREPSADVPSRQRIAALRARVRSYAFARELAREREAAALPDTSG